MDDTSPQRPDDADLMVHPGAGRPLPHVDQDYFSSVVQSMSDCLVVIDSDGRIAVVNQATLQLLGYSTHELVGQRPSILFADGTIRGTGLDTLHERGIVQRGEKTLRTRDGQEIPVFYSGSVLRDHAGTVQGIVCVMHDATMQKQLEYRLRDALRKQQELVQLKSQFVSTVSHEFRTPLAIIQANNEMLHLYQDRMEPKQRDECFDLVNEQIKHMINLLEGALTIEEMQAGKIDFQPVSLNLDRLCQETVEAAAKRINRRFTYTFDGTRRRVDADEQLMKQILRQLLSNAIKFSRPGTTIAMILTSTDQLSLQVCDQGIGIPEAELSSIFDPFFRASNVGATGGTGLGLAMAQMAVDMHGGQIVVESKPGLGTNVTVELPVEPGTQLED